eukprot:7728082-Lingulodinium_polyedra.AAC.1
MQATAPALGWPLQVALGTPKKGLCLLQRDVLEATGPSHLLPRLLVQLEGELNALQRADSAVVHLDTLPHVEVGVAALL